MEAEAFLLGHWKNFEELEANISLPELEAILTAAREREHARNKFAAALQGHDLDGNNESVEERFRKAELAAHAQLAGKSEEEYELSDEHGFFGFETEEE